MLISWTFRGANACSFEYFVRLRKRASRQAKVNRELSDILELIWSRSYAVRSNVLWTRRDLGEGLFTSLLLYNHPATKASKQGPCCVELFNDLALRLAERNMAA